MSKAPDVSIIVSTYNSGDLTNGALESVVSTAGDVSFEVWVIDDASTDGGLDLIDERYKKDSRFTFVQSEKNVGFSLLNNVQDRLRGTYLMLLDTDARLHPGALQSLMAFMNTTPRAGAATANLHNPDGSIQNYYRRLMTFRHGFFSTVLGRYIDKYVLGLRNFKSYHYDDLDTSRVFEIEQPPTACLMMRREALDSRIMDPRFHFFIDVDLCRRIYDRGYKIYLVPDAIVTHIKSASMSKRSKASQEHLYYKGIFAYFRKHNPLSFPTMWVLLWLDRAMRVFLERVVGRAPIR